MFSDLQEKTLLLDAENDELTNRSHRLGTEESLWENFIEPYLGEIRR